MQKRRSGRGNLLVQNEERVSTPFSRETSHDVRQRMDDVYGEMERKWKNGSFRLPLKFIGFHTSDVMFLFVRSAMGYTLAFIKVKMLQKEYAEKKKEDPRQSQHDREWQKDIEQAMQTQFDCATVMSSSYARLVLHCSNYENHKEDEHFFECVYYFVCSVVKLGVAAEYWKTIEEELGFLFRGSLFSANVKLHAVTAHKDAEATTTSPSDSSSSAGSAASKIQNLSAATTKEVTGADTSKFLLPKTRFSYFSESVPVKKIVSELDATKTRASKNMEISQAIRERISAHRSEEQRRQLDAVISPRRNLRLEMSETVPTPMRSAHTHKGLLISPRISMKNTYTTRSPALNHLLPTTEERVRIALRYPGFSTL